MALKAQIEANKIITDQFKEQKREEQSKKIILIVTEQLKILREDIKDFQHTRSSIYQMKNGLPPTVSYGSIAIYKHFEDFPLTHLTERKSINYYDTILREIFNFLSSLNYLLDLTLNSELDKDDKANMLKLITELFIQKLQTPIYEHEDKRVSKQPICPLCKYGHGLPEELYFLSDTINKKLPSRLIIP